MSLRPQASRSGADGHAALRAMTQASVANRMGDPYLTEHDRWVLRQFASFLNGVAPDPDPRTLATVRARGLHPASRRRRV